MGFGDALRGLVNQGRHEEHRTETTEDVIDETKQQTEQAVSSNEPAQSSSKQSGTTDVLPTATDALPSSAAVGTSGKQTGPQVTGQKTGSGSSAEGSVKSGAQQVKSGAQGAAADAKSGAQQAGDKAQGSAQSAADSLKGGAQQAKSGAQQAGDKAQGAAQNAADSVKGGAQQAKSGAQGAAADAKKGASSGKEGTTTSTNGGTTTTRTFKVGDQGAIDSKRGEAESLLNEVPDLPAGGKVKEEITVSSDKQHWEEAIQKTKQAEAEMASASLASEKGAAALEKAQAAQASLKDNVGQTDKLLAEAEQQRGQVTDPTQVKGSLDGAKNLLDQAQKSAGQHNKTLKDADAAFAAKQREVDGLAPKLQQEEKAVKTLTTEFEQVTSKRQAASSDAERLQAEAKEADKARAGADQSVEELLEKLRLVEADIAAHERDLKQDRENQKALQDKLQRARGQVKDIDAKAGKSSDAANAALDTVHKLDEKSERLRVQLDEHKVEQKKLLELVQKLRAELDRLQADLDGLRSKGDSNKQAIAAAEAGVNDKRKALQEAEVKSKAAEERYQQLVKEADASKAQAVKDKEAAKKYAAEHQEGLKEAKLHGDRHAELWAEAQKAGSTASNSESAAFAKLESKVEGKLGQGGKQVTAEE